MKYKRGKHPNIKRFKKGYIPWNKGMKYNKIMCSKVGRGHKKENNYNAD